MKLFTIGDSLSQGFMSGAAARTDLAFSTLLAGALGLGLDDAYHIPLWELDGHPVNLERLLRQLPVGDAIGPLEWLRVKFWIARQIGEIAEFYEDGDGAPDRPYPGGREWFHNVAVRGFDVADAWLVTPRLCREVLGEGGADRKRLLRAPPSDSFFRTALTVLNPSRQPAFDDFTALDWLKRHATGEGVENLVLWLGPNNILGSVIEMNPRSTADAAKPPLEMTHMERRSFNIWTPEHFEAEYAALIERVDVIMAGNAAANWKVFVANVPSVTVPPILAGRGRSELREDPFGQLDRATYFERYNYVFESDVGGLPLETMWRIDETVARYNAAIARAVTDANAGREAPRYFVVDIAASFLALAYKRNQGQPTYPLPAVFDGADHKPDTRYYRIRSDLVAEGGVFSLDGVHPSAIGQGLLAHEFRLAMQAAGVAFPLDLDWPSIVASDQLWTRPLLVAEELFRHPELVSLARKLSSAFRRDPD